MSDRIVYVCGCRGELPGDEALTHNREFNQVICNWCNQIVTAYNLDALLLVVEMAREVAESVECPQGSDPLDRLDAAISELNKLNED
jgi:hypothetical protein